MVNPSKEYMNKEGILVGRTAVYLVQVAEAIGVARILPFGHTRVGGSRIGFQPIVDEVGFQMVGRQAERARNQLHGVALDDWSYRGRSALLSK
jgi:hypothetical protein